jgi:DNA (cytosine-5-)-methyltransferase
MVYKTIDLCAGIGGIRRGFEMTGQFKNVLSAEIDEAACTTYEHLYGENPRNDLTSEAFLQKAVDAKYDVLLAGFPCQTFSRAGLQLGFRDATKGTIFFSIAEIISKTQPKAVFLENVENLISHDRGKTIATIVNTLEDELGYRIIGVTTDENGLYSYSRNTFVRNSKHFGLPQNRPRAYIMAFSKREYGEAIKMLTDELPTHGSRIIAEDVTAILDKEVDDSYYLGSRYLETLKRHKARERSKGNGFGYMVVNRPGVEHPIANTILATGGSGKERNLIYQPKAGVAGKVISGKRSPLNSEGIRVMTPSEWGKLQGFVGYAFLDEEGEERFHFPEGMVRTQQYKQFGNSVTIPVIEEMAFYMLECFEKMKTERFGR